MMTRKLILPTGLAALASALVLIGGPASAGSGAQSTDPAASVGTAAIVPASVAIDLCAKEGSITLPGTADPIPLWGYAYGDCSSADPATLPGPVIAVDKGVSVTVTLHNGLAESTSILFPGANGEPAEAAPGDSVSYTLATDAPGTYLYESGSNVTRQVPMGLYGALVVRSDTPNEAYDDDVVSAYDAEAVLVLSEIDPNLNAGPNGFDLQNWAPTYWLINGKAYPETAQIDAPAGSRVLLRYVNASVDHHTMAVLGMHQKIVAKDAYSLPAPFDVVAETIPAGSTADMIATLPAGADDGALFPLYNRQLRITNGNSFPGGQLTFLAVQATPAPAIRAVPRLTLLRAWVRGHKVRIVARATNCRPCSGRVKMRVRGHWRKVAMVRANGRLVGRFARVPRGRWSYVVTITDGVTGIRVTAPARKVRVR
jgi:FtsP/CotA-like multicopper oxidase with cupredoxin domain